MWLIFPLFLLFCSNNPANYTKNDITPLTETQHERYREDAAFLDCFQISEETSLDNDRIQGYYDDLVCIYNNSYKINNSFFENISRIHIYCTDLLHYITVSLDTNNVLLSYWLNDEIITGITSVDSIIAKYNIEIQPVFEYEGVYWIDLYSEIPFNYRKLMAECEETGEFDYVEPWGIIGGGNMISVDVQNAYRTYIYSLNWGDCPSGCLYNHYWKIKIQDEKISLLEEGGTPIDW